MLVVEFGAVLKDSKVRKMVSGSLKTTTEAEMKEAAGRLKRPDWQKCTHNDTFKLHLKK